MEVLYTPKFLKLLKKLPQGLQEEAMQKINLFKDVKNHELLKVHKLSGRLKGYYSFSVNYMTRIVFKYAPKTKNEAWLLAVGDHNVYNK